MSIAALKPGFEEVFTVLDYYDGPRKGIANFTGRPHFYDCIFDEARDDYSNRYKLTPISAHIFDLAMEDWAIWERWQAAFHDGEATLESHPALPQDRKRHEEIRDVLGSALRTDDATCVIKTASFVSVGSRAPGAVVDTQVKWSDETR